MKKKFLECVVKSLAELPDLSKQKGFEFVETKAAEEFKELGVKPKVFEAIASSDTVDRAGEVMIPKGMLFSDYLRNPTLMDKHNHWEDPVGKIISLGVSDTEVKILFHFSDNERGKKLEKDYLDGTMRAFSIGFYPTKWLQIDSKSPPEEVEFILPDGKRGKLSLKKYKNLPDRVVTEWILLENSCVNVGCNPDALLTGVKSDIDEIARKMIDGTKTGVQGFVQEELQSAVGSITASLKIFQDLVSKDFDLKGAVKTHSTPIKEKSWDATSARASLARWASSDGSGDKDKVNFSQYSKGFGWFDSEKVENFGSYKLPHHEVSDGTLVGIKQGVFSAMAALLGARGGVNMPDSDRRLVYNHLAKHYADMDVEPPEFKEYSEEELKVIEKGEILGKEIETEPESEERKDLPITDDKFVSKLEELEEEILSLGNTVGVIKSGIDVLLDEIHLLNLKMIAEESPGTANIGSSRDNTEKDSKLMSDLKETLIAMGAACSAIPSQKDSSGEPNPKMKGGEKE